MSQAVIQNQSSQQLAKQLAGGWIAQAIYVAAELGIADLLAGGPQTVAVLAEQTGTHSDALYRVLRALASMGLFTEEMEGCFALTPLAEALQSKAPGSLRPFAIMQGTEFYQSWGHLLYSVKTGKQGFQERYGVPFFQYMTDRPERHAIYDAAMMVYGIAETEPMLEAYDFSGFGRVVDVGGGHGRMLAALLERFPTVQGILFDLPAVVDRSRSLLADIDLGKRCQWVGGDFFNSVPAADAYVLRHIIHDWDDLEAISILRTCREAMHPEGRVLVVETVIPPLNEPCFGKWLDLMMLIVGGRERTEEQYRQLFAKAGLTLTRIVSTSHEVSIAEGMRAV